METIARWTEAAAPCRYVPAHISEFEYLCVKQMKPEEYMAYLLAGWRRFSRTLFRQTCSGPGACRSLRVDARRFRPNRSPRRTRQANEGVVRLRVGTPTVTPEKVSLFEQFHADRSETRDWSPYRPADLEQFVRSFAWNPFPTEEWCYHLDGKLVGVGYVDVMPGGLSAIYFVRDPAHRDRSLGTWNVLNLIDRALA